MLGAARQQPVPEPYRRGNRKARFVLGWAGRARPHGPRPREIEIMGLIADGLSNRQIAAHLVITEKTVKNHICSIYQRFGVTERSQAVSRWREFWTASDPPGGSSR